MAEIALGQEIGERAQQELGSHLQTSVDAVGDAGEIIGGIGTDHGDGICDAGSVAPVHHGIDLGILGGGGHEVEFSTHDDSIKVKKIKLILVKIKKKQSQYFQNKF